MSLHPRVLRTGGMLLAIACVALATAELFWKTTRRIPEGAVLAPGAPLEGTIIEGGKLTLPTTEVTFVDGETCVVLGEARIGGWISRFPPRRWFEYSDRYPNVPYWCLGGVGLCLIGIVAVSARRARSDGSPG